MAHITSDGAVIPSFMQVSKSSDRMEAVADFNSNNVALRIGYVVAVHHPGETGHTHDKYVTYDVTCLQMDGSGAESFITYPNCKMATLFGAAADWEKHTLRAPKSYKGRLNAEFLATTTKVLVLFANGRKNGGYIIATDSNINAPADSKSEGHNWQWVFNGVNWNIDKDGQLSLVFNGATVDENGGDKPVDPDIAGTNLKFDKDGSIILDNVKGESITIDKKNKKIIINSREMVQNATEQGWTVEAAKDVKVHAGGNIILNGDKKTYIGTNGASEPLVLGNKLTAAFNELISIFTSQPVIGALGQAPVTINPALAAALAQWQAKYGTPAAPILSKQKFTE